MTDAEEVERAAEAAWLSYEGSSASGYGEDRAHREGFTAGVAWAREQSAAKPAEPHPGEVVLTLDELAAFRQMLAEPARVIPELAALIRARREQPAESGEVAELRAEVEAAEAWQQNDTYSSRRGEYECRLDVAVSTMQDARRLLALRAAAGKPDAG